MNEIEIKRAELEQQLAAVDSNDLEEAAKRLESVVEKIQLIKSLLTPEEIEMLFEVMERRKAEG